MERNNFFHTFVRDVQQKYSAYGKNGDIPQADLKKVKNESFRSGKDDIYENHFDNEGNLIQFYFPARGVSLELNN